MSWSVIILSSRPWLFRSQVPRLRDKSLFIYLAVKYSVVTRYNQASRHIKFHSTKLEFHGQIATKFLLHCPRELANDVCVSLLFVFIHKIIRQFKTYIEFRSWKISLLMSETFKSLLVGHYVIPSSPLQQTRPVITRALENIIAVNI